MHSAEPGAFQANFRRRPLHVIRRTCGARGLASKRVAESSMPATIEKEPDQKRLVALLAAECHVPIGEMATLYAHERARLALGAHVTPLMSTRCLLHARWAVNARRRSLIEASSPDPRARSVARAGCPAGSRCRC